MSGEKPLAVPVFAEPGDPYAPPLSYLRDGEVIVRVPNLSAVEVSPGYE